jgi:hypothetical protein
MNGAQFRCDVIRGSRMWRTGAPTPVVGVSQFRKQEADPSLTTPKLKSTLGAPCAQDDSLLGGGQISNDGSV